MCRRLHFCGKLCFRGESRLPESELAHAPCSERAATLQAAFYRVLGCIRLNKGPEFVANRRIRARLSVVPWYPRYTGDI